ncbi:MAG: prepilin-type N-terminal cleavage/methylation domain-containing protein [Opitutales bacterium]|jgi:prepilin-type N-terminal cleavage/methylation domain-containing protein
MSAGRSTKGFTLMEMLLAVALAGLLLGATSFLIVGLTHIWTQRTDVDSFEEHADGVACFIQTALDDSGRRYQPRWTSPSGGATEGESDAARTLNDASAAKSEGLWRNSGVNMSKVDPTDSIEKTKLHFHFYQMPPALGSQAPAGSPGVEAWLLFEKERGLAIVWRDIWTVQPRLVMDEKDLLRSSLISAFVVKLEYVYLDQDDRRWTTNEEPEPDIGENVLPDFIRLSFEDGSRATERMIRIPKGKLSMPLF